MTDPKPPRRLWARVRRIWTIVGLAACVGFIVWCLVAYRATGDARRALQSDREMTVVRGEGHWSFQTTGTQSSAVGLVFFAGSMVEPAAYAPLARAVAEKGYAVLLVELPRRGAFGGADGSEVIQRARAAMQGMATVPAWIVAGHSRGGAVAARFVREAEPGLRGLVLVGTSHPREFSLAEATMPVVKILGSRDGVAAVHKSEQFRHNLPAATRWIVIAGANHSQFGCYGFQPGDRFATISPGVQQARTIQALVETLAAVSPRAVAVQPPVKLTLPLEIAQSTGESPAK